MYFLTLQICDPNLPKIYRVYQRITMNSQRLSCGLDCPNLPDLFDGLANVDQLQYSFVCMPVVHPRLRRKFKPGGASELTAFTRSDMLLDPGDWSSRIVARLSPYLCPDSPIDCVRRQHEDTLNEELNHCKGLGISTVMLTLTGAKNTNLARIIASHLSNRFFSIFIYTWK